MPSRTVSARAGIREMLEGPLSVTGRCQVGLPTPCQEKPAASTAPPLPWNPQPQTPALAWEWLPGGVTAHPSSPACCPPWDSSGLSVWHPLLHPLLSLLVLLLADGGSSQDQP